MAPEQITGDPVDHRADQFSIGVVFYELLAYTEPFPGDTLPAITHRILNEQPKSLTGLVTDLSPAVVTIVEQALRKKVAERFKDTESMRVAIARARRHLESDESWDAPTVPVGRDLTPPGNLNRGTGSARRRTGGAVGVAQMTPPPDPRRTDREALARRRTAQVEAALADARRLFGEEQFEAALDACHQALTLDESHVDALELEEQIQSALGLHEGEAVAEDPDKTVANEPLDPKLSSRLAESQAVTRIHEEEFAFTGLPPVQEPPATGTPVARTGVGDRTVLRPAVLRAPGGDAVGVESPEIGEATVVVPSRRTPPPPAAKPATIPPLPPPPPVPAAAPPPTPHAKQSIKVPAAKPATPDLLTRIKAIPAAVTRAAEGVVQSVRTLLSSLSAQQVKLLWASVAAVILVAIATTYFLSRGPVPTGVLVIDAIPWATVTALQAEDGTAQTLPESATTPLSFSVPAGAYQVTLTGPPPESKATTVTIRVEVDGVAVVPITRFQTMTAEQYFEPYLGSSTATGSTPPEAASAPPTEQGAAGVPAGTGVNQ